MFIWDGFLYEVCSRVWVWLMTAMIVMIWNCPSVLEYIFCPKSPLAHWYFLNILLADYENLSFFMWQAFIISFPCSNVALAGREWASKSEAPPTTRSTASRGEAPNMLGEVHGVGHAPKSNLLTMKGRMKQWFTVEMGGFKFRAVQMFKQMNRRHFHKSFRWFILNVLHWLEKTTSPKVASFIMAIKAAQDERI